MERAHGKIDVRGSNLVPHSPLYQGRFGRLFRKLPELKLKEAAILALAEKMSEVQAEGSDSDNPALPAGYTYLGQFIDHDITFDPTSRLQRDNDPDALENFRTPRYDLDSLYGSGPVDNPYMYQNDGVRLLLGVNGAGEDDLPRNVAEPRRALIGDPRNDENLLVSQIHLTFLKFHNRVVDELEGTVPYEQLFEEARRITIWHYQWVAVHDFLRRVAGPEVVDNIWREKRLYYAGDWKYVTKEYKPHTNGYVLDFNLQFYDWRNNPYMPVEFSAAAYRFAHSMIRPAYTLNDQSGEVTIFTVDGSSDLRGFRERPANRQIEWKRFFPLDDRFEPQRARRIDTKLSFGLGKLPAAINPETRALALLNLMRGNALGLPSGEAVARLMGLTPLDSQHLCARDIGGWVGETPLWYYILREAELMMGGRRLGPVGARIIAEVLIGLIKGDPKSFTNIEPLWKPEPGRFGVPHEKPRDAFTHFEMSDLIRYATGQG